MLGIGTSAAVEVYRCAGGPDASLHFTDDPARCEAPVAHAPSGRIVGSSPVVPRRPAPAANAGSDLRGLFEPASARWEVLDEPPETAFDPALRARGLRASVARHYTRARGPVSEVCTVELWVFDAPAQAAAVRGALAQPGWWAREAAGVLVLAHGVRLEREVGSRTGLVPDCARLAEATHRRALAR